MIKYCVDCVHSKVVPDPYNKLKCTNRFVIGKDEWELSSLTPNGKDCREERDPRKWFLPCGYRGRKFEAKQDM